MDELIGLLAEAAALSRRASAQSKDAERQAVPQRQPSQKKAEKKDDRKLAGAQAPAIPVSRPVTHVHQDRHSVDLTAGFHDRSSLLSMVVAVEVLGSPPSLRPREHF